MPFGWGIRHGALKPSAVLHDNWVLHIRHFSPACFRILPSVAGLRSRLGYSKGATLAIVDLPPLSWTSLIKIHRARCPMDDSLRPRWQCQKWLRDSLLPGSQRCNHIRRYSIGVGDACTYHRLSKSNAWLSCIELIEPDNACASDDLEAAQWN